MAALAVGDVLRYSEQIRLIVRAKAKLITHLE
jgi:hypothetical protein